MDTENEAAERLRGRFHSNAWDTIAEQFEEALATERRLGRIETVERLWFLNPTQREAALRIIEEANR